MGVVATLVFRGAIAGMHGILGMALAAGVWDRGSTTWFSRWMAASLLPALLAPAGSIVAGWAVARWNEERRSAMVLSYAAFLVVSDLPWTYSLATNALADPRYVSFLLVHLLNVFMAVTGVLVGGVWLTSLHRREPGRPRRMLALQPD